MLRGVYHPHKGDALRNCSKRGFSVTWYGGGEIAKWDFVQAKFKFHILHLKAKIPQLRSNM